MTVIDYKDWTLAQHAAAFAAMKAHSMGQSDNPVCTPLSLALVTQRLASGELTACFIKGYLLIYDVGPTWSTAEPLLYELLLIKALPEGDFGDYVVGLRQLAEQHACYGIYTGNSVLRPGLRRLYERAGFNKLSESYYMEV